MAVPAGDYLINERYRLLRQIGSGTTGNVYAAYDHHLEREVAIKILAECFIEDQDVRGRFEREIGCTARLQHPGILAVFESGELPDGEICYVMTLGRGKTFDGYLAHLEDHADHWKEASLVDRLTLFLKLLEVIAYAHSEEVVHRDLKPANVMLDGRGQVRITDFGLADFMHDLATPRDGSLRPLAGTPAYMAPEQLAAGAVSVRSDLFSLGLILYELFTGKRAIDGSSLDQITSAHESSDYAHPSAIVRDIDPAVESIILACLALDPARRPSSAAAIAAALPGGDPLAAAMAAGETPDPSVLAVSGPSGRLTAIAAIGWLAACAAAVLAVARLNKSVSLLGIIPRGKPPAVLEERARELLKSFGYDDTPVSGGTVWGFHTNVAMLDHIESELISEADAGWWEWMKASASWEGVAPVEFWYRHAPGPISPRIAEPQVTSNQPPPMPGEVRIHLDTQGRLVQFFAAPRLEAHAPPTAPLINPPDPPTPSWSALLRAANLESLATPSAGTPADAAFIGDAHAAWQIKIDKGPLAGSTGRLEAASLRGRPLLFQVNWPWGVSPVDALPTPYQQRLALIFLLIPIIFAPLIAGAVMARRNWLAGRGDRRGALRVGMAVGTLSFAGWTLSADRAAALQETDRVLGALGGALLEAALVWMVYLALEPAIRLRRPHALLSWTRLTSGRWRDPMVGRDVLRGATLAAAWTVLYQLVVLAASRLSGAPAPIVGPDEPLRGVAAAIAQIPTSVSNSIQYGLLALMALTLLGRERSRRWLARAAFGLFAFIFGFLMLSLLGQPQASNSFMYLQPFGILTGIAYFAIHARLGLLVAVAATSTASILLTLPTTLDGSAWYGPMGLCAVVATIAAAAWGGWVATRSAATRQPVLTTNTR